MRTLKSNLLLLLILIGLHNNEHASAQCAAPVVVANPSAVCPGGSVTLTASGSSYTYIWYNSSTGGIPIWTGATYTTLPLFSTTTYYVQSFNLFPSCNSSRTAITITVNPIPVAPTATVSPSPVCAGASATLTATAPGGSYEWFTSFLGGTPIATGAVFSTPPLTSNKRYFVQATVNGCTGPRKLVTVTITNVLPAAPVLSAPATMVCQGGGTMLTANVQGGGTVQWFDAATGGNLLQTGTTFLHPSLSSTTTWYAEVMAASGCVSPRASITVSIVPSCGNNLWSANGSDIYRPSGNVGIGTSTPSVALDVIGDINALELHTTGTVSTAKLVTDLIVSPTAGYVSVADMNVTNLLKVGNNSLYVTGYGQVGTGNEIYTDNGPLQLQNGSGHNENVIINANGSTGNVGIGTSTFAPNTKLNVEGNTLMSGKLKILGPNGLSDIEVYHEYHHANQNNIHDINSWESHIETENSNLLIQSPGYGNISKNTIINAYGSLGNVGIGTHTPLAKLQVDGVFLVNGATGTINYGITGVGAGTRMMWIPQLAAFRAGIVSATEADAVIGQNSVAIGKNLTASGAQSVAFGESSVASGDNSVAIGNSVSASANNAFAIGANVSNAISNSLAIGFSSMPTLFVSDKVGIGGTTAPLAKLHVSETGNSGSLLLLSRDNDMQLIVKNGGEVGIGTSTPRGKLDVNGLVVIGGELHDCTNITDLKLSVDGGIVAKEILVTEADWADYVFEDDYELASLDSIKAFIELNKHLPGVPSGVEIGKNGLNLASMDATLLKKIEELTLYVINLNKENKKVKAELEILMKQ